MTAFDPRALRTAFGRYMTGVTIVTARAADGAPVGFTANSFTSVSMDPPMLLVCPGKSLSSFACFAQCTHFGVNILSDAQEDIAMRFAKSGSDRFSQTTYHNDAQNTPLIADAVAQFSCRTAQLIDAGDHAILLGEVTGFETRDAPGLGYANGRFFSPQAQAQAQPHSQARG